MLFSEVKLVLLKHKKHLIQFGVRSLSLFGSVARNQQTDDSDIDVLVDFDAKRGLFLFVELKEYLKTLLKCEVDLVTKRALHPALRKRILNEAKNVF